MLSAVTLTLVALTDACPQPAAVEQKLSALRAKGAAAPAYKIALARDADTVKLTALDSRGEAWLERNLPASAPCDELEAAAAVMLLAWEAELVPGSVPVPELERRFEPAPEPAPPLHVGVRLSAAGEVWLSNANPTWGAGGAAELRLGRHLGIELGVNGQGRRNVALGPGSASWSRLSVALGPNASFAFTEKLELTVGAALVAGPLWVSGVGFDQTETLTDWDLGAKLHVRLFLPGLWQVRPFIGVGAVVWLRRHLVEAERPDAAKLLPLFEISPTLGLAFAP